MSFSKMLAVALTVLKLLGHWDHSWWWILLLVLIGKTTGLARNINIINHSSKEDGK